MADQLISLMIPDAKVTVALQGFLKIYPNVERVDPEDDNSSLIYTDKQWVVEKIRRVTIKDIRRGLQMIAQEAGKVALDDSMVETA